MRSLNFRDNVLWAIAHKAGIDPQDNHFLTNGAIALASYINAWVRRLYDAADFPEWVKVEARTPVNHIVYLDSVTPIGKVLKVYLVDPATTRLPIDTPFRMTDAGLHVGFDHGTQVWVKFIPRAPMFTAEVWRADRTFNKDEVTYSPRTGECYKSKVNSNRAHDPAGETAAQVFTTEITQDHKAANPGVTGQPQIQRISFAVARDGYVIPDPPPNLSLVAVAVDDETGATIAPTSDGGTGAKTIAAIMATIRTALLADPDLATFTITNNTGAKTMDIQDASNFRLHDTGTVYYEPPPNNVELHFLKVAQIQPYIPAVAPVGATNQLVTLTLSPDECVSGAVYQIKLTDGDGVEHVAEYTALPTDSAIQVLAGLLAAVDTARAGDDFFDSVSASIDTASLVLTFSITQPASLDVTMIPAGSSYWDVVPFPFMLVDPVVTGAYADYLKEQGQSDKAAAEIQNVPTETGLRIKSESGEQFDPLTDQESAKSRYAVR